MEQDEGIQERPRLTPNDDGLLPGPCPRLAGLVDMVQSENVFRRKLVVVYCVLCVFISTVVNQGQAEVLTVLDVRWLFEGCHLDECKAILGEVLVGHRHPCLQPLLCVSKAFVLRVRISVDSRRYPRETLTGLATNRNGTPCVRETSFEKWNTLMILSVSSASSSSRGIS